MFNVNIILLEGENIFGIRFIKLRVKIIIKIELNIIFNDLFFINIIILFNLIIFQNLKLIIIIKFIQIKFIGILIMLGSKI